MPKKQFAPNILTDKGLSLYENDPTLRDLDLPLEEIEIHELLWHLDMPVWEKDNTDDWNLTPREVLNKNDFSRNHQKRINEVDLRFPIIITKHKNKLVILDGIHRLCKAYSEGHKKIKAKVIPNKFLKLRI